MTAGLILSAEPEGRLELVQQHTKALPGQAAIQAGRTEMNNRKRAMAKASVTAAATQSQAPSRAAISEGKNKIVNSPLLSSYISTAAPLAAA